MHKGNGSLSAAVAAALIVIATGAQAQAQGLKLEISGQVNRAFMAADDGVKSDSFFVDNDNSGSRFRFLGSGIAVPGLTAGFVYEVEFQGNDSNLVSMPGSGGPGREVSPSLGERHTAIFLEGGWGKLTLGQTDGAANGGTEVDLSGTTVAHFSGANLIGGGIAFRNSATNAFGPTITATTNNQDFESRYDVVRYDTPLFGGFRLAGSLGNKGDSDVKEVALSYSSKLAIGQLAGVVGWSSKDVATGDDQVWGGSISWLHGSGFNVTAAYSNRELDAATTGDKKFSYLKVGYKVGKHAVSVDFGRGEDQALAGDEADFYGVGYVYTPAPWIELYGLLKQHTLDRSVGSFENINLVMVGTRVKF